MYMYIIIFTALVHIVVFLRNFLNAYKETVDLFLHQFIVLVYPFVWYTDCVSVWFGGIAGIFLKVHSIAVSNCE